MVPIRRIRYGGALHLRIPAAELGSSQLLTENRYADLTSGACQASAGCGREQTMTALRTTGHDTTVTIQSLLSGRACRT
jgi:hypothetical protein